VSANSREQQILERFADIEFSKEDAAEALGISVSGTYKLLVRMNEKKLLTSRKDGRQWLYSVAK